MTDFPDDTKGAMTAPSPLSSRIADSAIARIDPARIEWCFEHGFLLHAVQRVGEEKARPAYRRFVRDCMDRLVDAEGGIPAYRLDEFNLDQLCPGKVLFPLYMETGNERYRKAIVLLREQLRRQPRTRSGGFWHKKIYPEQVWLAGIYMAAPFYARYAELFAEPEAFNDVTHQILLVGEHARDPGTGLYTHAWDESRRQLWANLESGRSSSHWGRAMGWFVMGIVDALDYLPRSHADRHAVSEILAALLRAIAGFQDAESGLWYQVIDKKEKPGNYLEASASCMYVYAILKAVRLGYVTDGGLAEAARRAYRGVLERFVATDADGLLRVDGTSTNAGLGGRPYRDGSFSYYVGVKPVSNDPRGFASLILASLEAEAGA